MTKRIRVPLTNIYNRDIYTNKLVEVPVIEQSISLWDKIKKRKEKKIQEAKKLGRNDWKIYVDWLGWVSL